MRPWALRCPVDWRFFPQPLPPPPPSLRTGGWSVTFRSGTRKLTRTDPIRHYHYHHHTLFIIIIIKLYYIDTHTHTSTRIVFNYCYIRCIIIIILFLFLLFFLTSLLIRLTYYTCLHTHTHL